jgi:hypothetical protein
MTSERAVQNKTERSARSSRPERATYASPSHNAGNDKERVKGIEPSPKAWEAFVLPLNYTRDLSSVAANAGSPGFRLLTQEPKSASIVPLH